MVDFCTPSPALCPPTLYEFFAPCPRGLEAVLAAELAEIAGRHLDGAPFTAGAQVPGGVHFRGGWAAGMAANLHSRIASRILLKIAHRPYRTEQDVYALALEQPWERWFASTQTLRVDITAIKSPLKSLEFATLRVKDAICDRMREKTGSRPSIDTGAPDVRVFAFLTATECTLYLDTSGEPLFKRGWRLDKGAAPLRENLAAGILRLTGWTPGTPLYDPMCGSGTFLAEAAQIALGVAPGVERRFGFEKLKQYDITAWQGLKVPALDAKRAARGKREALGVYGSDISGDMLEKARANLERAGVSSVWLKQVDARGMTPPCDGPGIILANPPYGERIEVRGRSARGEVRETGQPRQRRRIPPHPHRRAGQRVLQRARRCAQAALHGLAGVPADVGPVAAGPAAAARIGEDAAVQRRARMPAVPLRPDRRQREGTPCRAGRRRLTREAAAAAAC